MVSVAAEIRESQFDDQADLRVARGTANPIANVATALGAF
jgi:hypothetical protein